MRLRVRKELATLLFDLAPVLVDDALLSLAPLAVEIGPKLQLRVKHNIVPQLGVFQYFVQVDLLQALQVDRRQRRHRRVGDFGKIL